MNKVNRRTFLEGTLAVSAGLGAAPAGRPAAGSESTAKAVADLPKRKLGKYDVSRLIIGANQFTGYPHAEPLKYAKELFAAYFTEEKIVETLAVAHDHGIDTHVTLTDESCVKYLNRFAKETGKRLQWVAQSHWFPPKREGREKALSCIKLAADNGAIACFLQGAACDGLVREKNLADMEYYLETIRKHGMLAGLAGHLNETIDVPIRAGIDPDLIMKTINTVGYTCSDPDGTAEANRMAGLYPDMPAFDERGLGDAGLPWTGLYTRIRPEYFDAADRRIQYLVDQGLAPCILGCWGYHLPWLGTEKMKQHWRYLIARWGALPVVWCASGEQAMAWYNSGNKPAETEQLRREWTDVIHFIRHTDPFHRLLTTHPRRNARDEVLDPTLLDFEMQQTGHGSPTEQHAARALEAWNRPPVMPVVCGESRYEGLDVPVKWTQQNEARRAVAEYLPLRAVEARQAFWAHLLNSGCAGHTYGANGVWQVNLPDRRFGASPGGHDWGATPWQDAMNQPGSTQLARAKQFLLTLPWHQLAPAIDVFQGATSAAATPDGRCALAFTAAAKPVTADLTKLRGTVTAFWCDPASGKLTSVEGSPFATKGARDFATPGKNAAGDSDWVLVLQDTAK